MFRCADRRRPDPRQVRGRQRGLARMAGGAGRTAARPGPVPSHRSRVPGMSQVRERQHGDQLREMRMANVLGRQVRGRRMAQSRMPVDNRAEEEESEHFNNSILS